MLLTAAAESPAQFSSIYVLVLITSSLTMAETEIRASEGGNYGSMTLTEDKKIILTSAQSKPVFSLALDNVSQVVVPVNNRNELEIQFQENDSRKDEDCLIQITFTFPKNEVPEDDESEDEEAEAKDTQAETFQKSIMDTGIVDAAATGNIIVEFSKDEGVFVAPRNRYTVQVFFLSPTLSSLCIPRPSARPKTFRT